MVSRILVPVDESEPAERALEYALETHPDAEIIVLHVVGEPSGMMGGATSLALSDDIDEAAQEQAQEVHDRAREIADENDAEIRTAVEVGSPSRAIVQHAEEYDLVVIGRHSKGSITDRLFVGNVAEAVVEGSPVPVTVVP